LTGNKKQAAKNVPDSSSISRSSHVYWPTFLTFNFLSDLTQTGLPVSCLGP